MDVFSKTRIATKVLLQPGPELFVHQALRILLYIFEGNFVGPEYLDTPGNSKNYIRDTLTVNHLLSDEIFVFVYSENIQRLLNALF